jgi:hypothetical protein
MDHLAWYLFCVSLFGACDEQTYSSEGQPSVAQEQFENLKPLRGLQVDGNCGSNICSENCCFILDE